MFVRQFQSAAFLPPYPPWCAPFYHGTNPQVNFLFLAFFLPVPYWRHISQVSKNNLLGGLAAPRFCYKPGSATQKTPKHRKIKGLLGGAEI